ncbi:MAG: acetyl-CoA hydrolase [Bdellovibrionales bacterium]|nr:acetyl-CoA hydrolase [Bdellovibrionales bacterium]
MNAHHPKRFRGATAISETVEWLFREFGKELRLATPLGLGKPNPLLNALYSRVVAEPDRRLVLFTALSLAPPAPAGDLARRFFDPFRDRHWGADYPELLYARDAVRGALPSNVVVREFYFQAGSALKSDPLQRNYISLNYTHVARSVVDQRVEGVLQLVARRVDPDGRERFSLSSNPDLTLDVAEAARARGEPMRIVGVVHPDLPFLGGDAEVGPEFFAAIVESPAMEHELFALPRMPIDAIDHRIGLFASALIEDEGTLQIGIGSLSDAVVSALILRHRENAKYRELVGDREGRCGPFTAGLYGLSEMVTDGFMHLRNAGILRREVIDEASGERTFLHGAFYLGSKPFYAWLRNLRPEEASGVRMTRVSKVNDLYDPNEALLRRQRKRARFLNTCMQATLLGGAASDTREDGRVVSGVGGQYNFVAMSNELPDARSVLMLRSTYTKGGRRLSNVVWGHDQLTIPRHLRDLVVTEYGVADLRGQDDETCVRRMIEIADAEFQPELVAVARRNGKLAADYEIPPRARENRPESVRDFVARSAGAFPKFPFGTDFTAEESRLVEALGELQTKKERGGISGATALARLAVAGGADGAEDFGAELARMKLAEPSGIGERLTARILRGALREAVRGGTG